jgi:hypothetical protein
MPAAGIRVILGVVESPAQHRGLIIGTFSSRVSTALRSCSRGSLPEPATAAGGPQAGPGGVISQTRHGLLGRVFQGRDAACSGEALGFHVGVHRRIAKWLIEPCGAVMLARAP